MKNQVLKRYLMNVHDLHRDIATARADALAELIIREHRIHQAQQRLDRERYILEDKTSTLIEECGVTLVE